MLHFFLLITESSNFPQPSRKEQSPYPTSCHFLKLKEILPLPLHEMSTFPLMSRVLQHLKYICFQWVFSKQRTIPSFQTLTKVYPCIPSLLLQKTKQGSTGNNSQPMPHHSDSGFSLQNIFRILLKLINPKTVS